MSHIVLTVDDAIVFESGATITITPTPTPAPIVGVQGAPWDTPWHSGDIHGPFPPEGLKARSADFPVSGYSGEITFSVGGAYSNPQLNVIDNSTGLSVHYGWVSGWKPSDGSYHLEATFFAPDRMTVLLVHP